jgi:DNA-binding response OmpR family regulator
MVDARALPAETGWRVCAAIIEEHYETVLAVTMRGDEADRSTRHDVAART